MSGATAASSGALAIRRRAGSSLTAQRRWALWGSYAALAVFVAMFLTPPFYMVMTSLKTSAEISAEQGNPWLAHHPTLQNFSELIANSNFQHFFLNSVIVTLCVVVISMAISVFAAFSLARIGFLGSQILATGVFLTYLIPRFAAVHPAVPDRRRARAHQQRLVPGADLSDAGGAVLHLDHDRLL